jgi:hypothetical protein
MQGKHVTAYVSSSLFLLFCLIPVVGFAQEKANIFCKTLSDPKFIAPVYASPGSPLIMGNLTCGQPIILLGNEDGFAKIQFGGLIGYISPKFVQKPQPNNREPQLAIIPTRSEISQSISTSLSDNNQAMVSLRWNLKVGEILYYDVTTRMTEYETNKQETTDEIDYGLVEQVIGVDDKGVMNIKISSDYVRVKMKINKTIRFYDSRWNNNPNDDFGKKYANLLKQTGFVKVNSNGDILELSGFDENPNDPNSNNLWIGNIEQLFLVLPAIPVAKGYSWERITKLPESLLGNLQKNKMTIKDFLQGNNQAVITARTTLEWSAKDQESIMDKVDVNLRSETIWDINSGRPHQVITLHELKQTESKYKIMSQWEMKLRSLGQRAVSIQANQEKLDKETGSTQISRAKNLGSVHRIYVDSFGATDGANVIREKVINRIFKSGLLSIVTDPNQADAIMTGIAEISQEVTYAAQVNDGQGSASGGTTYDATLVVKLISKDGIILWVDEAKPGSRIPIHNPFANQSVSSSVAEKIVKSLLKAIKKDSK